MVVALQFITIFKVTNQIKKFIELKRLSGEFIFVDKIGTDSVSLYVPILELEMSSFDFP